MTNVGYFRTFAAYQDADPVPAGTPSVKTLDYYFEHNREAMDFANLYKVESPDDDQKKMFHYTTAINPEQNQCGNTIAVLYTGNIIIVQKSDPQLLVDIQKGVEEDDGRYTKHPKDMINEGGILAEIYNFNNLAAYNHNLRHFGLEEVYGLLGIHADGIMFNYELRIEHDTSTS